MTERARNIFTTLSNVKNRSVGFWLNEWSMEHCGAVPTQENLSTLQHPCSIVILSPQILHLLAWDRNYVLRVDNSVSAYYVEAEDFILKSLQKKNKHFFRKCNADTQR